MTTIFISTGEVSGDLQGSLLIEALKRQADAIGMELEIVALGGERMARAGATLLGNTTGIGSVGILESLPFVLPTLRVQQRAKQYLRQHPPDLVILIDYMGPNLSIGQFIQHQLPQVPVVYYIAPQDWVWSANALMPRETGTIVAVTDQLLAIFPEEARYFEKKGLSVNWVGHPLLDRMRSSPSREEARTALGIAPKQTAIALVPASRQQELKYMMPVAFEAARRLQERLQGSGGAEEQRRQKEISDSQFPQSQIPMPNAPCPMPNAQFPLFWIPLSLEAYRPAIEAAIDHYGLRATIVAERTQEVLAAADLAIAKSGTVNLELALLNIPQVVFYRVSPVTHAISRLVQFSMPFMSPPNLVVMRSVVPELFQGQATPDNIVREALPLLLDPQKRQRMLEDYQDVRHRLGEVGVCDRAAREILQRATASKTSDRVQSG